MTEGLRSARRWLDSLLPPSCVCCGRGLAASGAPVCGLCWHRLPRVPPPLCRRCGATRPGWEHAGGRGPDGCLECETWAGEWRAAAPFRMEGRARRLIHALKYDRWTALADPMGRAMAPAARRLAGGRSPVLVPVPLSAARRRERGFNQASLLARALAASTGWPVARPLVRDRSGRRQARLGRRGRRENVARLFRSACPRPARPDGGGRKSSGPRFLLVDDVLTTGSTAAACIRTLEEAGMHPAGVVTFARALHALEDP